MWDVVTVERFDQWFLSLDESEQESMLVGLFKLKEIGPMLGRPDVETLVWYPKSQKSQRTTSSAQRQALSDALCF